MKLFIWIARILILQIKVKVGATVRFFIMKQNI